MWIYEFIGPGADNDPINHAAMGSIKPMIPNLKRLVLHGRSAINDEHDDGYWALAQGSRHRSVYSQTSHDFLFH